MTNWTSLEPHGYNMRNTNIDTVQHTGYVLNLMGEYIINWVSHDIYRHYATDWISLEPHKYYMTDWVSLDPYNYYTTDW